MLHGSSLEVFVQGRGCRYSDLLFGTEDLDMGVKLEPREGGPVIPFFQNLKVCGGFGWRVIQL